MNWMGNKFIRHRQWILISALIFVAFAIGIVYTDSRLYWMWEDFPLIGMLVGVSGIGFAGWWIQLDRLDRQSNRAIDLIRQQLTSKQFAVLVAMIVRRTQRPETQTALALCFPLHLLSVTGSDAHLNWILLNDIPLYAATCILVGSGLVILAVSDARKSTAVRHAEVPGYPQADSVSER